jgi:hypothetical protein
VDVHDRADVAGFETVTRYGRGQHYTIQFTNHRQRPSESVRSLLVLSHAIDLGDPEVTADDAVLRGFDDNTECLLQHRSPSPSEGAAAGMT